MMETQETISYHISTASKVRIGGRINQFVQDRWVELRQIDRKNDHLLFEYKLLDQKMEGSALIHEWAEDLEWLQTPIYFLTNLEGKLVGMQGLQHLKTRWEDQFREKLSKKYAKTPGFQQMIAETDVLLNDEKRLAQSFIGYNHFRALFQPLPKVHPVSEESKLVIPRYFGTTDLPLNIMQTSKVYDQHLLITNNGTLDVRNFDSKPVIRMFKDLTNTYNLKVDLQVDLEEEYILLNGKMESADLFLEVEVPDFYQVTTAHQVKLIHPGGTDKEKDQNRPWSLPLVHQSN
ncbi:hypothetical protein [Pedobacter caeni]|uniref:Uncharacterized protein n=1 Tax=Pedobacter caeni TaxID=288992 RepID=A0A1M4YVU0_9SPHI|nr:hypothetical protein [Pedobacter caeni]SHF09677.1 hypothetical protein SAMN04488522_10279 [Pedobacter caeni]